MKRCIRGFKNEDFLDYAFRIASLRTFDDVPELLIAAIEVHLSECEDCSKKMRDLVLLIEKNIDEHEASHEKIEDLILSVKAELQKKLLDEVLKIGILSSANRVIIETNVHQMKEQINSKELSSPPRQSSENTQLSADKANLKRFFFFSEADLDIWIAIFERGNVYNIGLGVIGKEDSGKEISGIYCELIRGEDFILDQKTTDDEGSVLFDEAINEGNYIIKVDNFNYELKLDKEILCTPEKKL